jgi:hypothetical protein
LNALLILLNALDDIDTVLDLSIEVLLVLGDLSLEFGYFLFFVA